MARRDKHHPGGGQPSLEQAHALWDQGRFDEALRKFNEAVRQAPNDLRVLIETSRALAARFQAERSVSLLERALRLGARRFEVQHAAGENYLRLGRQAEAEACFRRALRLADHPRSQLELGKICERRHALAEAEDLAWRALRTDPGLGPARILLARIQRRRGDSEQAFDALRQLIASAQQPATVRAEACGELCTLLDGAARYEEAWDAALNCKELLLPMSDETWSTAEFVFGRAGKMVEELTAEDLSRWQAAAPGPPRRVALLTGFLRSGTTLLEQVLQAHPEAISVEEIELFSGVIFPGLAGGRPPETPILNILNELTPARLSAARDNYWSAMQGMLGEAIGGRLLIDKNPAMTMMIPPMKRVFPELKLVIALRDPRDVVVSCFLRYLPINPVSACFLTLERTVDRYILDMRAWLKMRDLVSDWVEIRYEDAVADLAREARRAVAALGLPWDDTVLDYRERSQLKRVRSPTYEAVAKPIFQTALGRWRNYERFLAPALDKLAPLVKALGYDP